MKQKREKELTQDREKSKKMYAEMPQFLGNAKDVAPASDRRKDGREGAKAEARAEKAFAHGRNDRNDRRNENKQEDRQQKQRKGRGKRGKVLFVLKKKNRAIVEGLNLIKRHTRRSQTNPNGAIIEREGSIHISNLMRAEIYDARKAKAGK